MNILKLYQQQSDRSHRKKSIKPYLHKASIIQNPSLDSRINSLNQKRLNPFERSRKLVQAFPIDKKQVQTIPRQNIFKIINNLNSSDIIEQIFTQKRQALKKQWSQLQTRKLNLKENFYKMNKTKINMWNVSDDPGQQLLFQDGKYCSVNIENPICQIDKRSHGIIIKTYPQRLRSKTQHYNSSTIDVVTMNLLQANANTETLKKKQQHSNNSSHHTNTSLGKLDSFNGTFPIKLQNVNTQTFHPSHKQKIQLSQEKTKPSTQSIPRNYQSQPKNKKEKLYENEENTSVKPYSNTKFSKSVITQKIINLKKIFNKTIKQKSLYTGAKYKKQITQPTCPMINGQTIQLLNFPLIESQEPKKMTFQQLFHYEKKKMEFLKKILNEENKLQLSISEQKFTDLGNDLQSDHNRQISFAQILGSKYNSFHSFLAVDEQKDSEKKISHTITSKKSMKAEQHNVRNEDQRSKQKQFINLNTHSLQKQYNCNSFSKKSSEKIPFEQYIISKSNHKKKQPGITTYNFDYIKKQKPQRPQIKQLRHKYLYSPKRRFSKEDYAQYGIQLVSVHQGDQGRVDRWRKRIETESFVEDFLQIERKDLTLVNRNAKIVEKFNKTVKNGHKKYRTLGRESSIDSERQQMSFRKLDGWDDQRQNIQILEDDITKFSKQRS